MTRRTPLALTLMSTVLLAACGGGGGSDDTVSRNGRPLASAGLFVPEGQDSLVINLSACSRSPDGTSANSEVVNNATLTITAEGDVVLRGAPGSASTATELYRVNASESNFEREISYYAANDPTGSGLQVEYNLELDNDTDRYVFASAYPGTAGRLDMENPDYGYTCTLPAGAYSLPDNIMANRLAVFVDGTTRTDPNSLRDSAALIEGNRQITWDNAVGNATDPLSRFSEPYADARFLRLDWSGATATFSGSSSVNGTYTVLSEPPRTAGTSAYEGFYRESSFPSQGSTVYDLRAIVTWGQGVQGVSYDLRLMRSGTDLLPYATMSTTPASPF